MPPIGFDKLNFGLLDAKHEAETDERLLLDGYFDLHGTFGTVLETPRFLVLGYKGSGKSALAHHIKLTSERDDAITTRTITLNELSYRDFSAVVPGDHDWHARYPKVWTLALLLQLLDMFEESTSPLADDPSFRELIVSLRSSGLLPAKRIADAIRDYVDHPLGENPSGTGQRSTRLAAVSRLVDRLEDETLRIEAHNYHLLIIDGTDEIFTGDPVLLEVIASLVEAAKRLNGDFRHRNIKAKVVILCRSDLFAQLPGSNMQKLKMDLGIELDWYENTRDPDASALARLADLRARLIDPSIESIFSDYLPRRINHGKRTQPTLQMLLEHTRQTPRDFLQLLNAIKETVKTRGTMTATHRLSGEIVRVGTARYSKNYFAGAIQDELWGHLSHAERAAVVPILTSIGTMRFSRDEFVRVASENYPDLDAMHLLHVLFECSALGNVRDIDMRDGRPRPRYIFKYRNPDAVLNLTDDLWVHKGWRHKLSILDDTSRPDREEDIAERSNSSSSERSPVRRRRGRGRRRGRDENRRAKAPSAQAERSGVLGQTPAVTQPARKPRRATRAEGPPNGGGDA